MTENQVESVKEAYKAAKKSYLQLHEILFNLGHIANMLSLPDVSTPGVVNEMFIINLVEDCFGKKVTTDNQKMEIMRPRHCAAYLICKYTTLPLKSIAKICGQGHHTSVIHSKRTCLNWMDTDPKYRKIVSMVEDQILLEINKNKENACNTEPVSFDLQDEGHG